VSLGTFLLPQFNHIKMKFMNQYFWQ